MGQFRYIVQGSKSACHEFFVFDPHCYSRDIDYEDGTEDDYTLWFSGDRKYLPSVFEIAAASRRLQVIVKGSYQNEDRDEGEEPGTLFQYMRGSYTNPSLSEDEEDYLDIWRYDILD